jgi:hypothetical protein
MLCFMRVRRGFVKLDARNLEAFRGRALAYCGEQDFEHAIADFSEAAKLAPGDAATFYNRAIVFRRGGITSTQLPTTPKPSGSPHQKPFPLGSSSHATMADLLVLSDGLNTSFGTRGRRLKSCHSDRHLADHRPLPGWLPVF